MLETKVARRDPPLYLAAIWGVLGFCALVGQAVFRLLPMAIEPIRDGTMEPLHWAVAGVWLAFMLYTEAYRGFHLAFSPRLAARAMHLARYPNPLHVLLAPAYCMGLVHATRRRLAVSWILLFGIVVLVLGVRQLEQPWRGVIDGGVVAGLVAGTLSVLWWFGRALGGVRMPVEPDVPES